MKRILFFLLVAVLAAGCRDKAGTVNLIFDTDLGNDVDDAIAMVMMYRYADSGCANILAEGISKEGTAPSQCMDIFNAWYGYPNVPFGVVRNGADCETDALNYARAVANCTNEDGSPRYKGTGLDYAALPDAQELYKEILQKQPDGSVTMVTVGFSTNIARLLALDRDLVAKKVKLLVMMACNFTGEQTSEYNVWKDIESARTIVDSWPGEIVFSPGELGNQVTYPAEEIESYVKDTPLSDAYKSYLPMPYNRPCWDPTALVYAVEGGKYFNITEPGTVHISETGISTFEPNPAGLHRILSVTPEQADVLMSRIVELTSFYKPIN